MSLLQGFLNNQQSSLQMQQAILRELRSFNAKGDLILSKFDDVVANLKAAADKISKAQTANVDATNAVVEAIKGENSELPKLLAEVKAGGTPDTSAIEAVADNLNGLADNLSAASAQLTSASQSASDAVSAAAAADPNPANPSPEAA